MVDHGPVAGAYMYMYMLDRKFTLGVSRVTLCAIAKGAELVYACMYAVNTCRAICSGLIRDTGHSARDVHSSILYLNGDVGWLHVRALSGALSRHARLLRAQESNATA